MRIFPPFIISTCCIIMSIANAAPIAPSNYPAELKYNGKYIDPFCFTNPENYIEDYRPGYVELNKCSPNPPKLDNSTSGEFAYFPTHGYIGYPEPEDADTRLRAYSYYRVFKASPGYYFVEAQYSGGGSGIFTSLDLITRMDNSTFKTKNIKFGDRCNGGLAVDEDADNHKLTYKINFTPYDMVSISDVAKKNKKILKGLYYCANCCAALGTYEVNDSGVEKLQSIDIKEYSKLLTGYMSHTENTPEDASQICFNKIVNQYLSKGKSKLDRDELNGFVETYIKTCGRD